MIRHPVHHAGVIRQQLGDLNARDNGIDRLQRSAELVWCIGLGVIRLMLGRPAIEPDEDHRQVIGRAEPRGLGRRPGPQQVREAQARQAEESRLEKASPRHAVATTERSSYHVEHGPLLLCVDEFHRDLRVLRGDSSLNR